MTRKVNDSLTEKQAEILKLCPEDEFKMTMFEDLQRNFLYALMQKGYLNRWQCIDPKNRSTIFELTEKGKNKKQELLCGGCSSIG